MEKNSLNNNNQDFRRQIMEKIESGRIKMRPKWRFVLEAILWILGLIVAALASLYLISLTVFVLHRSGLWFAPSFGLRGWLVLLVSFPWLILAAAVIFIIGLEIFVRHYSFAWRYPLLYSMLAVMCLAVIGGLIVAATPLQRNLRQGPGQLQLPPPLHQMRPFYEQLDQERARSISVGIIIDVGDSGFTLQERHGETLTVVVTRNTRLPQNIPFKAGDTVVVFGQRSGNSVAALGINFVDPQELLDLPCDCFSAIPLPGFSE